ncbi:MAG: RdgB/HAM1 family non-canonical purine NTP pyrophosphatase [Planctomycetes bacterium]|nr:RdgB/HAM1 family non-canonical purine NTP pyrophosphatase [Planctomycetota bacterium]
MTLVLATKNAKKIIEMQHLLSGLDLDVQSVDDARPGVPVAEESGSTFEENACIKALWYAAHTGSLCVADDSGLEVDALRGAPGVWSSRFAGVEGDDGANNRLLLEKLEGVPDEARGAQFRCAIALAIPGRVLWTSEGLVRGRILTSARGSDGFGYDPLFYFPEWNATFAEVPKERKATVSHRGQALARLRDAFPSILTILRNLRDQ